MTPAHLIPMLLLIPLVVALWAMLLRRLPLLRDLGMVPLSLLLPGGMACLVWRLLPALHQDRSPEMALWMPPVHFPRWEWFTFSDGLSVAFHLEPLGLVFAGLVAALWPVTVLYSIGYLRANREEHHSRFHALMALAVGAALWVAFAANLLTLFIGYEWLTLLTFPLVVHSRTHGTKEAGSVYLRSLLVPSLLLFLPAMLLLWQATGTLEFTPGGMLREDTSTAFIGWMFALCVFGTAKLALMPLHRWLPAAMVAPAPVSGLLHAVAVVKAGIFVLAKLTLYVFGLDALRGAVDAFWWNGAWLPMLAGISMVWASLQAWRQENLKRMLAYSTLAQLAMMVAMLSLFTAAGLHAAFLQMLAHGMAKLTLFFVAGYLYAVTHRTQISEMRGMAHEHPLLAAMAGLAMLSMVGLPPAYGFWSKWQMLSALVAEGHLVLVAALLFTSLMSAGYYLRFWMVLREGDSGFRVQDSEGALTSSADMPKALQRERGAHFLMLLALSLTALAGIGAFFLPAMLGVW